MTDFIGDIHGHADELEALLLKLGYKMINGVYTHPTRTVLFVGDYIDRGPKIKETLAIVKGMVDSKNAIALMGNHEYNALCFHYQETEGGHVRKHDIKNIIQHFSTLSQFQNMQQEYESYLEWFKTLPLFYETNQFRAVHACWDKNNISTLKEKLVNNTLNDSLIYESAKKGTAFNKALEETLKGKEIKMPAGMFLTDKDKTERAELRIKWWENPVGMTYRSISVLPIMELPEIAVETTKETSTDYYNNTEKPVFFGHYWLNGNPAINGQNVCCLDYSVAKKGKLVAYRFSGENYLDNKNLVFV